MNSEIRVFLQYLFTEFSRILLLPFDWIIPKDKNIMIYGAFSGDGYGENSRFLFEYAVKHERKSKHYWVTANQELYLKLKKQFPQNVVYAKSWFGMKVVLRSKIVFVSDQITDVYYILSGRHTVINLWHGLPLRTIKYCSKQIPHLTYAFMQKLIHKNDYLIAGSESNKYLFAKCFRMDHNKILPLGLPRNDVIHTKNKDFDFSKYKYAVLYAPTLRHSAPPRFFPFKDFSLKKLEKFLMHNKILMILRGHKGNTIAKSSGLFKRKMNAGDLSDISNVLVLNHDKLKDIHEIFGNLSAVITDYSSFYFDFLLTGKPVLFTPYDLKEYEKIHGFLYEYDAVTPGPKVYSFKEFKSELLKSLKEITYFQKERELIAKMFFKYQDENSSKRIMSLVKTLV